MLIDLAENLFTHMRMIRRKTIGEKDRADRSIRDHMNIIEALEARDTERAEELVRNHALGLAEHVASTPTIWTELPLATGAKAGDGQTEGREDCNGRSGSEEKPDSREERELTDGFNLIIDALKLNGLTTIYGVPGIPITDFGRMAQAAGIRVLSFRHEQNAGYAASIAAS